MNVTSHNADILQNNKLTLSDNVKTFGIHIGTSRNRGYSKVTNAFESQRKKPVFKAENARVGASIM